MDNTSRGELRDRVNSRLDSLVAKFYEEVPWATHFLKADKINHDYYRRTTRRQRSDLRSRSWLPALWPRTDPLHPNTTLTSSPPGRRC